MAPVASTVKALGADATHVATGAQHMLGGAVQNVSHDAEQVLQPLSSGIGGGLQKIGGGIGGGIQVAGSGVGEMMEWLPIAGVGALGLVLLMENESNKRGGSFVESTAKKMRLS